MDTRLAPNEFTPADFASNTLPHLGAVTLGPLTVLKSPPEITEEIDEEINED